MGWAARERYEEWRRSHALLSLSGLCSLLLLLRTRSAKNHQVTKYPASHHIRLRSPGTVSLSLCPLSLSLRPSCLPARIPPCCVGTRDKLFTCWLSSRRAARTSTLPRPCRPVLAPTPILARQPTTTTKSTPNTNMRSPCLRAHRGTLSCMPMCGRALSRNRSHSCNNSVAAVASLS